MMDHLLSLTFHKLMIVLAELGLWENRIKVLMLATALRGPARDFYDSLTKKERRNFELLSERLAYRFGSSGIHRTIWLRRLENRKRNPSESIVSFAEDIRQLCQKAYSDLNCFSQEILALDQLYRNVSPEMHCRCLDSECTTVGQAVNVIQRYEAILGFQQTNIKDRSTESPAYSRTTIATIMQHIENRFHQMEVATKQNCKFQRRRDNLCYHCKSPNHLLASCPRKTNTRLHVHQSELFRSNRFLRPFGDKSRTPEDRCTASSNNRHSIQH